MSVNARFERPLSPAEATEILAGADGVELSDVPTPLDVTGGDLRVAGRTTDEIGHAAYTAGVELHELTAEASDLEKVFLDMTADAPDEPATVTAGGVL